MRLAFALLIALSASACTLRGSPDDWGAIAIGVGRIINNR